METNMKISVILCTRDRHETIGQAIASIAANEYPDFDIHIMDQSTSDVSRRIIEDIVNATQASSSITYHHLDKAGLSRAYNHAFQICNGDIIALTDDDCMVPTNWLAQIAVQFDNDPQAGLLYGQVLIPENLRHLSNDGVIPSLAIPKFERLIKGSRFKVFGMGANAALRRSILNQVRGFDEALGGGGPLRSSQDFDFAYRTYLAGKAIILAPEVTVDHYGFRTGEQWPTTLQAYGIGDGAFYAKHIRCGDSLAFRLFVSILLRSWARDLRDLIKGCRSQNGIYSGSLIAGVRESLRFRVDKKFRLYQETESGKMDTTQANIVTAVSKAGSEEAHQFSTDAS